MEISLHTAEPSGSSLILKMDEPETIRDTHDLPGSTTPFSIVMLSSAFPSVWALMIRSPPDTCSDGLLDGWGRQSINGEGSTGDDKGVGCNHSCRGCNENSRARAADR